MPNTVLNQTRVALDGQVAALVDGTPSATDIAQFTSASRIGAISLTDLATAVAALLSQGGLTLLASHTAVSSASLDFTARNASGQSGAIFQADFDTYIATWNGILPSAAGANFLMQFSADGGSSWVTTNYLRSYLYAGTSGFSGSSGSSGDPGCLLSDAMMTAAANGGTSGRANIYNPLSTAVGKTVMSEAMMRNNNDSVWYQVRSAVYQNSLTAMNACRFIPSSGNFASGSIYMFGVQK